MLIVDSLLVSGVKFVLDKLVEAARAEMYDDGALREELLAAQLKLELGEITEEEFTEIEAGVLVAMREVRARRGEESGPRFGRLRVESVDADLGSDDASSSGGR